MDTRPAPVPLKPCKQVLTTNGSCATHADHRKCQFPFTDTLSCFSVGLPICPVLPKLAESGGVAPQSVWPIRLFSRQRPRLGGFTLQIVPAAGFAPASIRLEGGGLSFSATRRTVDLTAGVSPAMPRPKRGVIYLSLREENGPFTRTCTSISSFARSRPSFWTMKGKGAE